MIETAFQMLSQLHFGKFAGIVLYEGPSKLDGKPIVAIATKITNKSKNKKTGRMAQVFIIRSDVDPITARFNGDDRSICGDCKHRHEYLGTCYVDVGKSVASVYRAYKRDRYARPNIDYDPSILTGVFSDKAIRIGAYGDPAAAPVMVWRKIAQRASGTTGYTHQWPDKRFKALKRFVMASVDTPREQRLAREDGWRTFRIRMRREDLLRREMACPASNEMGNRATCASCMACGGTNVERPDISIVVHGPRSINYERYRERGCRLAERKDDAELLHPSKKHGDVLTPHRR